MQVEVVDQMGLADLVDDKRDRSLRKGDLEHFLDDLGVGDDVDVGEMIDKLVRHLEGAESGLVGSGAKASHLLDSIGQREEPVGRGSVQIGAGLKSSNS